MAAFTVLTDSKTGGITGGRKWCCPWKNYWAYLAFYPRIIISQKLILNLRICRRQTDMNILNSLINRIFIFEFVFLISALIAFDRDCASRMWRCNLFDMCSAFGRHMGLTYYSALANNMQAKYILAIWSFTVRFDLTFYWCRFFSLAFNC